MSLVKPTTVAQVVGLLSPTKDRKQEVYMEPL